MRSETAPNGLARVLEAAQFLSVSRSKVYAMMDGGDLPYVKLGKSRRIPWVEVLKLVDRHTVLGGAEPPTGSPQKPRQGR
jgi:excisionase family DNA binding protein